MTENSMFFSNGAWYTQVQFARFLKDIFSDGVCDGIDNELEVIANTPANMAVQVKTGRSYVRGYIHEILTDPVQLAIEAADPTNPRIDRVVLHLDVNSARSVIVKVLKGTASASPVAPTLTQTSSIWQISLAQVRVNANATVINSGNITDERTYMWYCRDNQPKASTTEYGAVKVGSGILVNNGVISVDGSKLRITTASRTNTNGFAVGTASYSLPTPVSGNTGLSRNAWITAASEYALTQKTFVTYNAFVVTDNAFNQALPQFTFTGSCAVSGSASKSFKIRALRHSDSSVLGIQTGSSSGGYTTTITCTATLPSDWDWNSDTIDFQVWNEFYYEGQGGRAYISVPASTISGTVYYNPAPEE